MIGAHQYAKPGAYPVVVTVVDTKTGLNPLSNINVSHLKGVQFEPTIAVDPSDPSRVFAAAVDETGLKNVAAGTRRRTVCRLQQRRRSELVAAANGGRDR